MSTLVLVNDFRFTDCKPDISTISRKSGNKYEVYGCKLCGCTVAGKSLSSDRVMVVRPGTFDDTSDLAPQAHIWIKEKQNWVDIPEDLPSFEEGYDPTQLWPENSLERLNNS